MNLTTETSRQREPGPPRPRSALGEQDAVHGTRLRLSLTRPDPKIVVVTVDGEVDLSTAGRLREFLRQRLASCLRAVVLDLTSVTFFDSTGLELLGGCLQRADENDVQLRLVFGTGSAVERLLRLTGTRNNFRCYETVEDAVATCPPAPC